MSTAVINNLHSPKAASIIGVDESQWTRNDRLYRWSQAVKIAAGWVCEECGEMDKSLLDSHHIKPKSQYPSLQYEVKNGRCLCLWDHAIAHKNNLIIMNMILARLANVLYKRFCKRAI